VTGGSSRSLFAGVETGGTKLLCRVVTENGEVLGNARFATGAPDKAAVDLSSAIRSMLRPGDTLRAVGLASFGPIRVDPTAPDHGRILATAKLGWSNFDLRGALEQALGAPVAVDTDVNAAALAEQRIGAARGLSTAAYVTVGTGIGGGLAVEGRTLKGGLHPEIGHLRLRRLQGDVLPSRCPFHDDCAEGLAAGPAVQARLDGRSLDTAPEVRATVTAYLAQLFEILVLTWSPQAIVLGGGVATGQRRWSALTTIFARPNWPTPVWKARC
jgi:fructokinase